MISLIDPANGQAPEQGGLVRLIRTSEKGSYLLKDRLQCYNESSISHICRIRKCHTISKALKPAEDLSGDQPAAAIRYPRSSLANCPVSLNGVPKVSHKAFTVAQTLLTAFAIHAFGHCWACSISLFRRAPQ